MILYSIFRHDVHFSGIKVTCESYLKFLELSFCVCCAVNVALTLKCGQGFLIIVDYDGLLGGGGAGLAGRVILVVQPLHVELQMAITIKPEMTDIKTISVV